MSTFDRTDPIDESATETSDDIDDGRSVPAPAQFGTGNGRRLPNTIDGENAFAGRLRGSNSTWGDDRR
ncbi:hypothetical protein ACERIT_03845 [Halopenitus sp. H-Gu1]|uniref:hypothetical protein n=1 Tax=Halopenitus sp. H-Gu1 TaxID=3242697 RepID=UPI00359E7A05